MITPRYYERYRIFFICNHSQRETWLREACCICWILKSDPRINCPWQIDASPIPPTKKVIRDPVAQAAKDEEPLPDSGNMVGLLMIVAKTDIELSGGTDSDKAAILARLAAIKTKGDARRYVDEVMARVDAKRKSGSRGTFVPNITVVLRQYKSRAIFTRAHFSNLFEPS